MRHRTKTFWLAMGSALGMVITSFWAAVSATGWPPQWPGRIPWIGIIFGVFAFASFFALLWENLRLRTPSLQIVYKPGEAPFVFDKEGVEGKTLRVHRIGVSNVGASANNVSVKLHKCEPLDPRCVYPGHELWPMGYDHDVREVTIHRSGPNPLVFFDVIGQLFSPGEASDRLHIRYAAKGLYARFLPGDRYRMTLAIHGPGASDPVDFVVERDVDGKQWHLVMKSL